MVRWLRSYTLKQSKEIKRTATPYTVKARANLRMRGIQTRRVGVRRCRPGTIRRNPYVRIKDDRRTFIPASCITNVGNPGKGLIAGKPGAGIGRLRKGNLSVFGYKDVRTLSEEQRHKALEAAVSKYGSLSIWRKLNALFVYTKNTAPDSSVLFHADRDWVKARFGIKAQ
jgi:hypothetical protein